MGVERRRRRPKEIKPGCSALRAQHPPPQACGSGRTPSSSGRTPPNSGHLCRRGSRPREQGRSGTALRAERTKGQAGCGLCTRASRLPRAGGWGARRGRPARWTRSPGAEALPPPTSNLSPASPELPTPPPTPLASPPGPPRSKTVAGNTSKRSRSRRGRSLMARPVQCPVPVRECSRRLRR